MVMYAAPSDLERYAVGADAFATLSADTVDAALSRASAIADEYLAQRFSLPISAWSEQLRGAVCAIAAYELYGVRGYNPELGADMVVRQRYDDALRWLREVRDGAAAGIGIVDATPDTLETRHVIVSSRARRGW